MKNHKGIIAYEGFPFIISLSILTFLALFLGFPKGAVIAFTVTLFVTWFFRNPEIRTPEEKGVVVSPADGKVIMIGNVHEDDLLHGAFIKISIFMNVFNVHVNRIPYSGTVKAIRYKKGRFISANLDKASSLNEQNAIVIVTEDGQEILTVQIAGLIARRIVCWIKEGMRVERGNRLGLIRFGSRLDIYLPPESIIMVKIGDKVKAGETVLGALH